MALISCPECKKEVSDTVKKCPHCGFVMRRVKWNWWMIGSYAISIFALILVSVEVNKAVSTTAETFIGIVASLIGAAATIIVGAQIYNSIETKRVVDTLESKNNSLVKTVNDFNYKFNSLEKDVLDLQKKSGESQLRIEKLYSMCYYIEAYTHEKKYLLAGIELYVKAINKALIANSINFAKAYSMTLAWSIRDGIKYIICSEFDKLGLNSIPIEMIDEKMQLVQSQDNYSSIKKEFDEVVQLWSEFKDKLYKNTKRVNLNDLRDNH